MTIDEYLKKSEELIEYADSISEGDPDKAIELLSKQLKETIRLISRIKMPEAQ